MVLLVLLLGVLVELVEQALVAIITVVLAVLRLAICQRVAAVVPLAQTVQAATVEMPRRLTRSVPVGMVTTGLVVLVQPVVRGLAVLRAVTGRNGNHPPHTDLAVALVGQGIAQTLRPELVATTVLDLADAFLTILSVLRRLEAGPGRKV